MVYPAVYKLWKRRTELQHLSALPAGTAGREAA